MATNDVGVSGEEGVAGWRGASRSLMDLESGRCCMDFGGTGGVPLEPPPTNSST